jgi:hypothetical protein
MRATAATPSPDPVGASLLERIRQLFRVPDIQIWIAPDQVVFRHGTKELSLRPVIHLATGPEPAVLEVGERAPATEPSILVELFDGASSAQSMQQKRQCLEFFLRYGWFKLLWPHVRRRPRAEVVVSKELSSLLCGESQLLESACRWSGLREWRVRHDAQERAAVYPR